MRLSLCDGHPVVPEASPAKNFSDFVGQSQADASELVSKTVRLILDK